VRSRLIDYLRDALGTGGCGFFFWSQKGFSSVPAHFWGKIWSQGVLALSGEKKITSFDETKNEEYYDYYYEFNNKKN
jgi:ABC-type glycerol-3-phosphate transport system substrate-binding protein